MTSLSVQEAAVRAATSTRTVRRWLVEGKLNGTRTVDGWTVDEDMLASFLRGRPAPVNGHLGDIQDPSVHMDGRPPGRPSTEAPYLAHLLSETQAELMRRTEAAAMWQARAEMLGAQLGQAHERLRALEAPRMHEDEPQPAQDAQEGPFSRSAVETPVASSESAQARPGFWTRLRAALRG